MSTLFAYLTDEELIAFAHDCSSDPLIIELTRRMAILRTNHVENLLHEINLLGADNDSYYTKNDA